MKTIEPREEWLRKRIIHMVDSLAELENMESWDSYKELALAFSVEIQYAVNEWDKYYPG